MFNLRRFSWKRALGTLSRCPKTLSTIAFHQSQRILEAIAQPIEGLGQDVIVSASIGIALGPQDGTDVESIIKNADLAMYAAKDTGKYLSFL